MANLLVPYSIEYAWVCTRNVFCIHNIFPIILIDVHTVENNWWKKEIYRITDTIDHNTSIWTAIKDVILALVKNIIPSCTKAHLQAVDSLLSGVLRIVRHFAFGQLHSWSFSNLTRQVYNGPHIIKSITLIEKQFLVKNDFWTKKIKKCINHAHA